MIIHSKISQILNLKKTQSTCNEPLKQQMFESGFTIDRLNFRDLQNTFPIDDDPVVAKRMNLLELELKYLKDYNVSVSTQNFMDYFSASDLIGRGAFGTVFRIEHDGKLYALKRVKLAGEMKKDERTLREINNCHVLRENDNSEGFFHPNLVHLYHYCIDFDRMNTLYINLFMEFCPKNLNAWFKSDSLKNERSYSLKKTMFLEICSGLKYINGKEIIHRDLKPANILLDALGSCKIADFGLSRLLESESCYVTKGPGTELFCTREIDFQSIQF
jgi:serine/threonine protein kinase